MIDFSEIKNIPERVLATGHSGVAFAWSLSVLFNFEFSIDDYFNIVESANNLVVDDFIKYCNKKNLYVFHNVGIQKEFNFFNLLKSDIVTCMIYDSYYNDKTPHISVIRYWHKNEINFLIGNPNNDNLKKLENFFIFFVTKLPDISDYVRVKSKSGEKLFRSPNYGLNFK